MKIQARRMTLTAAAAALAIGAAGNANAQTVSGTVTSLVPSVSATYGTAQRTLSANAPVYMDDIIRTGPQGEAQIRLRDDTRLVIGHNSVLTIDEFVYGGSEKPSVAIAAARGAFRFITGNSPKDAYEIRTRVATIGIRGTQFDFNVEGGRMRMALFDGEAEICNRARRCVTISGPCSMIEGRRFLRFRPVSTVDRQQRLLDRNEFPYITNPNKLQEPYQVDSSSCATGAVEIRADGTIVSQPFSSTSSTGPSGTTGGGAVASTAGNTGGASDSNRGFGNGGEGSEGATETGNPGQGGGPGGGNGNGNGNN